MYFADILKDMWMAGSVSQTCLWTTIAIQYDLLCLCLWEFRPFMLVPIFKCNWRIDLITIRGKPKQKEHYHPHTRYPSVPDWEPLFGLCCVPKHSLSVKCLSVHFVPCPERSLNQWPPIISQHCGHTGSHTYPVRPVLVGAWRVECWPVMDRIRAKCQS